MVTRRRGVWVCAAVALLACAAACAPWPDDWDGVGFVRSVRTFDVRAFAPHAPGYPGWVLCARALRAVLPGFVSDATVSSLVSALGMGTLVAALGALRPSAAPWLAALLLGSPLVALAGTSVGTDLAGLAWACAALALALVPLADSLTRQRWTLAGACAAMALAVRPSLLPVGVALAVCGVAGSPRARAPSRRERLGLVAGAALVGLACAGFVRAHHPTWSLYLEACVTQWRGHFGAWGNAATADGALAPRAARFAWNAAVDGLGIDRSATGALRAAGALGAALAGLRSMRARERRAWGAFVLCASAWGILAQNVHAPRHALPVCVALVWVMAHGLAALARARAGLAYGAALACAGWLCTPTAGLAWEHRTREPPGLALAQIASREGTHDALLFGARSARFGELVPGLRTLPRAWMGEVDATLERLDRLPRAVFVTSEVRHRARVRANHGDIRWVATACRDPRLERGRDACVALYRYAPR